MSQGVLPVHFTRRATSQIATAADWWEANRPAARGAITAAVDAGVELLGDAPHAGSAVTGTRLLGVRRIFLERIDYHLYYRVNGRRRRIDVLAFWHSRRQPPLL